MTAMTDCAFVLRLAACLNRVTSIPRHSSTSPGRHRPAAAHWAAPHTLSGTSRADASDTKTVASATVDPSRR